MTTREGSARRRLNFQREKKAVPIHTTRSLSRSASLASQGDDGSDILLPGTIKSTADFFASSQFPAETESQAVMAEQKHAKDVRTLIHQGEPRSNGEQYAAAIREHLAVRVKAILKEDEWIFEGEKHAIES